MKGRHGHRVLAPLRLRFLLPWEPREGRLQPGAKHLPCEASLRGANSGCRTNSRGSKSREASKSLQRPAVAARLSLNRPP